MQQFRRNGARGPSKCVEASARAGLSLKKGNVIRWSCCSCPTPRPSRT